MKVVAAELFAIQIPLKRPFIVSYASYDRMPSVILKLITEDGVVGYGEAVPDEHVTGETWEGVFSTLKTYLLPAIMGMDVREIGALHQKMDQVLLGNPAAKAAVDIAAHDILGKIAGLPIYALLGGKVKQHMEIPKVLSILPPDEMAVQAKEAVALGFRAVKLKVGIDLEQDIERVRAVRKAVGEQIEIRVDANQGWKTSYVARRGIEALAPFHVAWVEQPTEAGRPEMLAELRRKSSLPIMADESVLNMTDLRRIIDLNAVDLINIKLMKCGGIYPATRLATQAHAFGLQCQIGSMVESSIATAAGFHVAAVHSNIISTEISGPTLFADDTGDLTYDLPRVNLPALPGLGIHVDESAIQRMTRFSEKVNM